MRPRLLLCIVTWFALAATARRATAQPALPPPPRDYVVQPNDTCAVIAQRELGDRGRITEIHKLNPGLGKLPHVLKPGSILKLPVSAAPAADATLSASRGSVRVRKPEITSWDLARRGMELFRAWRVNSETQSTAEVTFRDTSRLLMRENTIVIIFGPVAARALTNSTAEAVLESGGLEARLDGASKRRLVVKTPSSESVLEAGMSLVTVTATGASIVANHGGAPIAVRGVDAKQRPRGKRVEVTTGMGSKIERGKLPDPPRKLPASPVWMSGAREFVDLTSGATVRIEWGAVVEATSYRIVLLGADGRNLSSLEVPATTRTLEAWQVPAGSYVARVSTIDAQGFESIASADRVFSVVAATVIPPGRTAPLPHTVSALPESGLDLKATDSPMVAAGSRLIAPAGMTCRQSASPPAPEIVVTGAGAQSIQCTATDGVATAPLPIRVAPTVFTPVSATGAVTISRSAPAHLIVKVASDASVGEAFEVRASEELQVLSTVPAGAGLLDVEVRATGRGKDRGRLMFASNGTELAAIEVAIAADVVATIAPPAPAPRRRRFEIAGFGGYRFYRRDARLGSKLGGTELVDPDTELGARFSYLASSWLGVDTELAFSPGSANAILAWRVNGNLTVYEHHRVALHAVVGGGGDSLLGGLDPGARRSVLLIDGGLRALAQLDRNLGVWLDLRDDLHPNRDGGVSNVPGLRAGFFGRF